VKGLLTARTVGVAARETVMRSATQARVMVTSGWATPPVQDDQVVGASVPVVSVRASAPEKSATTLPNASVAVTVRPKATPAVCGSGTGARASAATGPGRTVTVVLSVAAPRVPVTGQVPATVAERTLLPGGGPRNAFPPEVAKVTPAVAVQLLPKASVATAV
jgi:hypothetical protein